MSEIPRVPLEELGEWGSGGTPLSSRHDYYGGGIPWLIIEDLNDGKVERAAKSITEVGLANSSAKVVPPGTLLIAMYGSIGKLGISAITCATNQAIAFCKCDETKVVPTYLFFRLLHERVHFVEYGRGGTQQNISQEFLRGYIIPLPPLEEQRRVAALLARADRLRRIRRFALQLSDTFLESAFVEMFGDPIANPRSWPVETLADVCIDKGGVKAGPFGSSLKKEFYAKSGVRIYGQEQVIGGDFSVGDYYISEEMFVDFTEYQVRPGDILVSLVGSFGKVLVVPPGIERGIINPRLVRISPRIDRINSVFLGKLLEHPITQQRLTEMSHGGTMGILNAGLLKEVSVVVPPLAEQKRFANLVTRFERHRTRLREAERQADHLFQRFLADAFSEP